MVLYEKAKVQLLPSAEEPMLSEKSAPSPLERRGTSLVDRTDLWRQAGHGEERISKARLINFEQIINLADLHPTHPSRPPHLRRSAA
jgi:hypothetical protein